MVINFVGNYQSGYVGEQADQVHLAREMEALGHTVHRVPQDIWKAYCEGERNPDWEGKLPIKSNINIITKWPHFIDGSYVVKLREMSGAPVLYWVWDYMEDQGIPTWHTLMAKNADLYLTNEFGLRDTYRLIPHGVNNLYYFPFDVCDGELPIYRPFPKKYDVVFFGSCIGQGHRIEWLSQINSFVPVTCFSWNWEEWKKRGFEAYPPVYGNAFNEAVAKSRVILGFSVNPSCYGYWSNRVGKVLRAGGNLLYEYAPGMELMVGDAMDYFSSPEEAVGKIKMYLADDMKYKEMEERALLAGERFTSAYRVKQLMILCDRFIKTGGKDWKY